MNTAAKEAERERPLGYVQRMAIVWDQFGKVHGRAYFNYYALLAVYGKAMLPGELTAEHVTYLEALSRYRGGLRSFCTKLCHQNSAILMMEDRNKARRLSYCEGVASCGTYPFEHGWVLIDGKVADVTLDAAVRTTRKRGQVLKERREYFGVEFGRETFDWFMKRGHWEPKVQVREAWRQLLELPTVEAVDNAASAVMAQIVASGNTYAVADSYRSVSIPKFAVPRADAGHRSR